MQSAMPAFQPYNLFRRRRHPGLFCTVRQDRPVLGFVRNETWSFGGIVTTRNTAPTGFTLATAEQAMRLTGYYLFQVPQG